MNSNIKELLGSISKLLRVIEPKTYEVIQGNGDKECFGVKETAEVPKPGEFSIISLSQGHYFS